jgi:transcriptional regulator with XRE-family HTH domain
MGGGADKPSRVDRAQLGANIRAARKAAGLTGKELAERLEVSAVAVSQFERGTSMPAVTTFAAIAEVLGVPYGVLFGEPWATAEHLVDGVRERVRALGFDLALIPRDPTPLGTPEVDR